MHRPSKKEAYSPQPHFHFWIPRRPRQVFFVSIGKPSYRFVVWREAVRSLSQAYMSTMLDRILKDLDMAHEYKGFDVIAIVCDGASEQ